MSSADVATMTFFPAVFNFQTTTEDDSWSTSVQVESDTFPVFRNESVETASTVAVNEKPPVEDGMITVVLATLVPAFKGYGRGRYRVAKFKFSDIDDWNNFENVKCAVMEAQKKKSKTKNEHDCPYLHSFEKALVLAHRMDLGRTNGYWGTQHGVRVSDWTRDGVYF